MPSTLVHVPLGPRSYEIQVAADATGLGPFARAALDATWAGRSCRRALIVTDANLEAQAVPVAEALQNVGIDPEVAVIPPGEASKSLEMAATLYDRLIATRADRHSAIVAFGGGV